MIVLYGGIGMSSSGGERFRFSFRPWEKQQFTRNEELRQVSNNFLGYLRLWDALEGKGRDIIDFDLVAGGATYEEVGRHIIGSPTKEERRTILEELRGFRASLERIRPPTEQRETHQLEFFRAKVKAHIAYCQRRLVDVEDYPLEYIEATMGIKPELIPEDELQAQKEKVESQFKELGARDYSRESIDRFRQQNQIATQSIEGHISHNADVYLRAFSRFLGEDYRPKYSIQVVQLDEYWINWANGNRENFRLQLNTHRRHNGKWTLGKTEEMPAHEIVGHFVQMDGWRRAIDRGDLNPALGLTSVHDPEQVTTEGIAQTLPYFVPEINNAISPMGKLEIEVTGLRNMVYNNVHIWANTKQKTEQEMLEYVQNFYPWESQQEFRKQVEDRTNHPVKQTYLYAYGMGFYLHRKYAQSLNEPGRRSLLRFIYNQPTTPQQEAAFVDGLLSDPAHRFNARPQS